MACVHLQRVWILSQIQIDFFFFGCPRKVASSLKSTTTVVCQQPIFTTTQLQQCVGVLVSSKSIPLWMKNNSWLLALHVFSFFFIIRGLFIVVTCIVGGTIIFIELISFFRGGMSLCVFAFFLFDLAKQERTWSYRFGPSHIYIADHKPWQQQLTASRKEYKSNCLPIWFFFVLFVLMFQQGN